ncbi:MAG: anti-sigma factor family protein [Betaproteobacteria bacterium]
MTCANPIDFESLVAWWLGELPEEREATLEEHLIGCAHCSKELERLAALAAGVRASVRQGRVSLVVPGSFVQAMKEAGLHLREYEVDPGGSVNCTIRAGDDAVVSHLRAPLSDVQRLDVVQTRGGGEPELRLADVPFDARTGEVLVIPSAAWLRTMPAFTMRMKLIAVGVAGESEVGEYTFLHSPS